MTTHVDTTIERYLEGRVVDASERDRLFGHLDRCERCRSRFDELAIAHRALSGTEASMPGTELDLIAPAVIEEAVRAAEPKRSFAGWLARVMVPVAAVALVVVGLRVGPDDHEAAFAAKGGGATAKSVRLEVLCFDEKMEIAAHLRDGGGSCPAPGFVKLVFGSVRTVDHLSVAVLAKHEVRLFEKLTSPKPRSIVPGYAKLMPGETLDVIAVAGDEAADLPRVRVVEPMLRIEGAHR